MHYFRRLKYENVEMINVLKEDNHKLNKIA